MKPALIAAVVLAAIINFAPGSEGQQRSNTITKDAQTKTHPDRQPLASRKDEESPAAETKATKSKPPRWYESPEWVLVIGIITCFVIGWQSWATSRAAQAAHKSAAATEKSVTLQEIALRQWISVENWRSAGPIIPEGGVLSLHIQFDVVNPTDLPLTLNCVFIMFSAHGVPEQGGKIGRKNLIPPKKRQPVVTSVKITEEQALKWEDEELVFIINGSVEFEDVLEKVRNQPFSGLIGCSKRGRVRFIPPYGSGLYITKKG